MAKIEDCPGFETFGADVKAARKAKQLSRSALADMIHCDSRYLANIENEGTLPSLPVVIQLIKICGLPVERYFNPELMREESAERQRVSHSRSDFTQKSSADFSPSPLVLAIRVFTSFSTSFSEWM